MLTHSSIAISFTQKSLEQCDFHRLYKPAISLSQTGFCGTATSPQVQLPFRQGEQWAAQLCHQISLPNLWDYWRHSTIELHWYCLRGFFSPCAYILVLVHSNISPDETHFDERNMLSFLHLTLHWLCISLCFCMALLGVVWGLYHRHLNGDTGDVCVHIVYMLLILNWDQQVVWMHDAIPW